MADKHLTENLKGNYFSSERKDMTFLKGITLVALLPIWLDMLLPFIMEIATICQIILY